MSRKNSNACRARSRDSNECCVYLPTMTPFRLSTTPVVGRKSRASNFNNVIYRRRLDQRHAAIHIDAKITFFKMSISVPGTGTDVFERKTGGAIFAPQSGNLKRNEFSPARFESTLPRSSYRALFDANSRVSFYPQK